MATNPLAPYPTTDIDGPEVFPEIDPPQEDIGEGVPLGEEEEDEDEDDELEEEEDVDEDEPFGKGDGGGRDRFCRLVLGKAEADSLRE
jgi:hypothetical protein